MSTKKLVQCAVLLSLGILLPQAFHLFGIQNAGGIFLPMHIPILLAGFLVGPYWGFVIGIITPILSHLMTGMPPMSPPILPLMIVELGAYGLTAGILYQTFKQNSIIALLGAMIAGRGVYGVTVLIMGTLLHIKLPPFLSISTAVITGIPGILLQVILIPILIMALEKNGMIQKSIIK